MKIEKRKLSRKLRSEGKSIKEIAKELQVSVSSVSAWTKDVVLTEDQRMALEQRVKDGWKNFSERWSQQWRDKRRSYQNEGRQKAKENNPLHLLGVSLYWAEGAKSGNVPKMSNSDPSLLKAFVRFLHECLGIPLTEMRLRCRCYTDNGFTVEEIEDYWLSTLGLPRECLRKSMADCRPTSSSGNKRGKLPYGVAEIAGGKSRELQHIFGAIQEYGQFEQKEWLR